MESSYFKIVLREDESVKVASFERANFHPSIHFHPEYQITMVLEGQGYLLVQDKMCTFEPGDIFLIGANVPHLFRKDAGNVDGPKDIGNVKSIEVYFTQEIFSTALLNAPETVLVDELLKKSSFGVKIPRDSSIALSDLINRMVGKSGFEKIIFLLRILDEISKNRYSQTISFLSPPQSLPKDQHSKIQRVYEYIMKSYHEPISLKQVASFVNMSHYTFCRFIKLHTGKTFVQVLNEIRIGFACKHLVEGNLAISEIAYRTGFENLSNFIRQFKKINGETPSGYQKRIRNVMDIKTT